MVIFDRCLLFSQYQPELVIVSAGFDAAKGDPLVGDHNFYSVLVSASCPKALYHLESDNLFCITLVVADWLG